MLEIKQKTKLTVKIYDQSYEMNKPTFSQVANMQLKIEEEGEKKALFIMRDFIHALGLPLEVIDELEVDQVISLIQYVSGDKKKAGQG